MDSRPPSCPVHGISQARILEWVAISFIRGSSWPRDWTWVSCIAGRFFTTEPPGKVKVKSLSPVRLFATLWTVAYQAPPSMGFSRQGYWSGLSFSSPGDLANPGIEPGSPTLQADALTSEPPGKPEPPARSLHIYVTLWEVIRSWAMRKTLVQSLGRENSLKKEMAIHSSTCAWKVPWTEEPCRLQSMASQRLGHKWVTLLSFT